MSETSKPKIGLVLSGGGARGIAHLGVLTALEEMGFRPSVISGVSVGALIGATYAAGYSPLQILELAKEKASFRLSRLIQGPTGLFSASGLRRILQQLIPVDSFEALQIPLFITATDILCGTSLCFNRGTLHDIVIGSASIPGLFQPVPFGQYGLVDGGILNNLPTACIREQCDLVIGSHVNKLYNGGPGRSLGRLAALEYAFHLAIAGSVATNAALCNIFIEPLLPGHSMFDMRKADELFQAGYQTAKSQLLAVQHLAKVSP